MSRHQHLNQHAAATGPTLDDGEDPNAVWLLRETIDAAARDIVDAIDRHARYAAENPDAKDRARALHRDLTSLRAVVAQKVTKLSGDGLTIDQARVVAEELLAALPAPSDG